MADNQNLVGGYELRNCVASGSMTQIWEVCEPGGSVPVAMKILLPESLKDPVAKGILKHEFKVGSQMEHPSFVRFHKIEINRDHGFFIMDYFRAPSLKTQISGNLAEIQSRFKKIVEAVCQAFQHLNEKGWLHRDIKPDNILVNKTGEVRVIDFSLAMRAVGGMMMLVAGKQKQIKGTRTYIAPEVILKRTPTVQSDIYSLGVTLYELLVGAPPFAGLDPNDLLKKHLSETPAPPSIANPNVTAEVDAVIMKMLSKKPKDRPADMREVMSMFRNPRIFQEDPLERQDRRIREAKANESLSVDKRLDSRADADRVSRGLAAPAKPTKGKRLTAPIGEIQPLKKTPSSQPAQQPQMPMAMPGMVAPMGYGMPGMMHPGMMMPPQMMPPQMAPPQMMPPQMMPPQMASPQMMPPQMMPPQMAPPQMMAPQMMPPQMMSPQMPAMQPPAAMPPAGVPIQQPAGAAPRQAPAAAAVPPQPAAPAPVRSAAPVQAVPPVAEPATKAVLLPLERRGPQSHIGPEEAAELDFMTELPDVL